MAFVGAVGSNSGSSGTTSFVVTKYTSTASGHLMIVGVTIRHASATISAPDGTWTAVRAIDRNAGDTVSTQMFWKVAGGSEPSTYTFTISSSAKCAGWHGAWSGIDPSTPIDTSNADTGSSSTSAVAPTITAANATDLIYSGSGNTTGTWTATGGLS